MYNHAIDNIRKTIQNLIEKAGYINNNLLLNDLAKLSYNPPSYRVMANITLRAVEQVNPGISSHEAWRLTTGFVENMKANLIMNNKYFQQILKDGLESLANINTSERRNIIDNQNTKSNKYEYLEKVNIHINQSVIFYDYVLFINGFPLVIIKIIKENTFDEEFIELENTFDEFPMFFNFNKLILLTDGEQYKLGTIYDFPEEYTDFVFPNSVSYKKDKYDYDLLGEILDRKNIVEFIKGNKKVSEMLEDLKNKNILCDSQKDENVSQDLIKENIRDLDDEDESYYDFTLAELFNDEHFQKELSEVTYSGLNNYRENLEVISKYQKDQSNRDIFEDIVIKNQPLVKKIAERYLRAAVNTCLTYDDLVSSGNIGMFRAIEKFDPSKGYQFSTYATNWINQRISRDISNEGRMIRVPIHQVEDILKLIRLENQMLLKEETIDDNKLLSKMEIDQAKLRELRIDRERFGVVSSTDILVGDSEDRTLGELMSSEKMLHSGYQIHLKNPATRVEDVIFKEELIVFLKERLTDRELDIVLRRNGIYDDNVETLEEIAETYHLTRERIRQIEAKAYRKLRKSIKFFINVN